MSKTVQSISTEMYYVLFTKVLQRGDSASGTVLQKSCSSHIFFKDFDHNYYNGSLKYTANRTLFFIALVTVSSKSEVFIKNIFSQFEDTGG